MKSLLVILVVISFFATGEAIKCYVCSPPYEGCDDPFDKSGESVKEVTVPQPVNCTKTVFEINSKTYTIRSFSTAGKASDVKISRGDWVESMSSSTYYCDTDLCNGGTSIKAALSTFMAFIAMILISTSY